MSKIDLQELEEHLSTIAEEGSFEDFFRVLLDYKKDLSWNQIKDICNRYYDMDKSESYYRKQLYPRYKEYSSEEASELFSKINKEKVKLHDENIQARAYIRKIAREETFKEIALEAVKEISSKKLLNKYEYHTNPAFISGDMYNEGILLLSDWHFGMVCDNAWNFYDEKVAIERVNKLKEEVIYKAKANNVKVLHVLNLGDMIAGRIHLTIRLESRFDVITQTMKVSELLAELLNDLSEYFQIEYYSCLDNHSRLEPNKNDAMNTESLTRITDWYIKQRLPHIHVNENRFGEDIITFKCKGFNVLGVHGHYDKPLNCVKELPSLTRETYDLICMAHRHHFSCDESNETLIVANSSLMGVDTYAKNARLSALPSQNLIVVSDRNIMEALYRIIL